MKTGDGRGPAPALSPPPSEGEAEATVPAERPGGPAQSRPETEESESIEPTLVDVASDLSFPASDPPCWTLGREAASDTPEVAPPQPALHTEREVHGDPDPQELYEDEDEELPAAARS
ncbi:MAG: hypothetical protein ACK47B_16990 [Armatimonadota bacterium]